MARSPVVDSFQPGDRLMLFRPMKDSDGVTRYKTMLIGWDVLAKQLDIINQSAASAVKAASDAGALAAATQKAFNDFGNSMAKAFDALSKQVTVNDGRIKTLEDASFRYELLNGRVVTAGTAVRLTYAKPFTAPPVVISLPGWNVDQIIEPGIVATTATTTDVVVKRSRGTLLLTTGPFENAPANTNFSVLAIGR